MDRCKKQIRKNVLEHLYKLGYEVLDDQLMCPENLDKDIIRDIYVDVTKNTPKEHGF